MRKILFILAMVVSLSASVASAQRRCDSHHEDRPGYEHRGRHHRSPYFVSENKVFLTAEKSRGASASSFSILRDGYAKDTWSVYYCGAKWTGRQATHSRYWALAMPRTYGMYISTARKSTVPPLRVSRCFVTATPRILGTCISTQLRLKELPLTVSKVLRGGYAKDTWNTYYFGRKID